MARDWVWKRLEEKDAAAGSLPPERRGLVLNRHGDLVRYQAPREIVAAAERFAAMTKEVDTGLDLPCLVFTGGDTFRVDDETVTTPRRFIYEYLMDEELPDTIRLRTYCRTPRCCRISHLNSFTYHRAGYRTHRPSMER